MTEFTVFTWNTQGNFTHSDKIQVINHLFTKYSNNNKVVVGLIQEGGDEDDVNKNIDLNQFVAYNGGNVGSFLNRCSIYALISTDDQTKFDFKQVKLKTIGGGVAGRIACAIECNNEVSWGRDNKVMFVSWHSKSSSDNEDTKNLFREIDKEYHNKYPNVLIGGDFNTAPSDIETMLATEGNRSSTSWNYEYRYVFNSKRDTHKGTFGGQELDFFVLFSREETRKYRPERQKVYPSDHYPVVMKNFKI